MIQAVVPSQVPVNTEAHVTITGVNLGNGTDILTATVNDEYFDILSQSSTTVVLNVSSPVASIGNVTLTSLSFGISNCVRCFKFLPGM